MNAGELAEQLSRLMGHALSSEEAMYPDSADSCLDSYEDLCRSNSEIILKSLRFSADMERLWRECPNNVTVYHGGLQDTPAWITAGLFREKDSLAYVESGFHADIYTAARNAVEQLEGKSP